MLLTSESQIMQWGRVFVVSIILFLGADVEAFATKPSPPLNLTLTSHNLSDGQTELTLQAVANATVEKVEMTIDLPPEVSLVSGEVKWDGAIAVGEKKEIKALVRTLSNNPIRVIGKALVNFLHGGSLTQQETLLLNAPKEKPLPPGQPPILRKQGDRMILEYKE